MPVHPFRPARGRLETFRVESRALRDNLLGDPGFRTVAVYLPPDYETSDADYPLFVELAAFTSSGLARTGWKSFGENVPQRIDRLVDEGRMGPVVVAFPDCFTSLGGNQYVDSEAVGRWEAFLVKDLLPAIEARYRVRDDRGGRAVFGKSSGGYGALVQGMLHADRWGAVACHSGDLGFEMLYLREMPKLLDALARHDSTPADYVERLREAERMSGEESYVLMLLGMAASYDADPSVPFGIRLPVEPRTCRVIPERWERWTQHDPLRMVEREECAEALRSLKALFVDCGSRDQFLLHYGARAFADRLGELGVSHRFEEFDGTHSGIDHRLDVSLPYLFEALTKN